MGIKDIYYEAPYEIKKAYTTDSGYDIKCNEENISIKPNEIRIISTGIKLLMPIGIEAQVRPRSGLAAKHGITVLNSPGTIDNGYRGEIKVILINHGKLEHEIKKGDKIAQMIFSKILDKEITKISNINTITGNETERQSKGFGSSD